MNNILYILSHKTLTDFEIPLLIYKGYGVLTNKIYKSLSVKNSLYDNNQKYYYDNFIYLDPIILNKLNLIDWFDNNQILDDEIIIILNKHFKIIFLTPLTDGILLQQLINNFTGTIYYRFFGRESTLTYVSLLKNKADNIKYIFSYNEIYSFERQFNTFFNEKNSLIIPLGLSNKLLSNILNTYNPQNNKICFICSKIGLCSYYTNIYNNFVENFSTRGYVILGKNNSINDNHIINNLDDENYYKTIRESKLMYYHGKEPRHLHYHPIEAIIIGIPIIFHSEGLLSRYLPNSLGKCDSLIEVKEKINKIINNEHDFINSIISEQNKSIELFTQKYNLDIFDVLN